MNKIKKFIITFAIGSSIVLISLDTFAQGDPCATACTNCLSACTDCSTPAGLAQCIACIDDPVIGCGETGVPINSHLLWLLLSGAVYSIKSFGVSIKRTKANKKIY